MIRIISIILKFNFYILCKIFIMFTFFINLVTDKKFLYDTEIEIELLKGKYIKQSKSLKFIYKE